MDASQRNDWLAARRTGIGSSDAPALALKKGEHRGVFRTPHMVYADKVGAPRPDRSDERMAWGLRLEPVIAQAFADETGLVVLPSPGLMRHQTLPHLLATPDFRVAHPDGSPFALLECKNSDDRDGWEASGTDDIPEGYVIQVQHQLEVADLDVGYVAVLLRGSDFRWYRILRHRGIMDTLLPIYEDFWSKVILQTPPPPDWSHPSTPAVVEALCRPREKKMAALDVVSAMIADDYVGLGREMAALKLRRERARAELALAMGDAELGHLPDGRTVRRRLVARKSYSVAAGSYVRTDVVAPPREHSQQPLWAGLEADVAALDEGLLEEYFREDL